MVKVKTSRLFNYVTTRRLVVEITDWRLFLPVSHWIRVQVEYQNPDCPKAVTLRSCTDMHRKHFAALDISSFKLHTNKVTRQINANREGIRWRFLCDHPVMSGTHSRGLAFVQFYGIKITATQWQAPTRKSSLILTCQSVFVATWVKCTTYIRLVI